MKFIFEVGDKFYQKDYSAEIFSELMKSVYEYCDKENLKAVDGEDLNGPYKIIVSRSEFEDLMDNLRNRRIQELKSIRESLEYSSVDYDGAFYNVDEISLLRLYGVSELMKSNPNFRIDLKDADNYVRIDCGTDVVNGIIAAYAKRAVLLNTCYNLIKKKVMQATSVSEVNSISTDDMFLVDFQS